MPIISVIVPIYNAEKYLRRCINSILSQTFTDFELLLVNDGSADSSGVICDEYAQEDNRIKVFHKVNGGVSSARNIGLDNMSGSWVCFVDADDYIHYSYLENLIGCIKGNIELVITFSVSFFNDRVGVSQYEDEILRNDEFSHLFTKYDLDWRTSPWAKLFAREIIDLNKLRFNTSMPIGEDLVFLYKYLAVIKTLSVNGQSYYYYSAEVEESLTKKNNPPNIEYNCMMNVIEAINKLIDTKNITDAVALNKLEQTKFRYITRTINSLYRNKYSFKERIQWLRKIQYEPYLLCLENKKKTFKESITYILIKKRFFILFDLLRILKRVISV